MEKMWISKPPPITSSIPSAFLKISASDIPPARVAGKGSGVGEEIKPPTQEIISSQVLKKDDLPCACTTEGLCGLQHRAPAMKHLVPDLFPPSAIAQSFRLQTYWLRPQVL